MKRLIALVLGTALVLSAFGPLLVSAGSAPRMEDTSQARDQETEPTVIYLSLKDIYYDPPILEIPANEDVTIMATNDGVALHSFHIDELDIASDTLPPGESIEIAINAQEGVYEFYCSVPGHREAGMFGQLFATADFVAQSEATVTPEATEVPTESDSDSFLAAEGVTSSVIGQLEIQELPNEPRLYLESIIVPAGNTVQPPVTTGGELLYVLRGPVTVADEHGFSNNVRSGFRIGFPQPISLTLTATEQDAEVLRLSLGHGGASDTDGSPAAGTPMAAQTPALQTETLLDVPLTDAGQGPWTLFMGYAEWEPNAQLDPHAHEGPIAVLPIGPEGLYVTSPSGLEGFVEPGQSVVLPATAPLIARNEDSGTTSAWIVGLVISGPVLMDEWVPTPTPTLEPTATEAPTETPVPTETPAPTDTPVPTVTPVPTQTSTQTPTLEPSPTREPTAVPTTEAGTILQLGESWKAAGATLTVTLNQSRSNYVILTFSYQNTSGSRVDFLASNGSIRMYDDQRNFWRADSWQLQQLTDARIILESGETAEYRIEFVSPVSGAYSANVFLTVEDLGEISAAKWGFTFNEGRVLTIPPDAVDPTLPGSNASTSEGQSLIATSSLASLESLLPTPADVPGNLVHRETRARSLDEVAQHYTNASRTVELFTSWGWTGNMITSFAMPNGVQPGPTDIHGVYVSVHQFADADAARAALDFSLDEQAAGASLMEVASPNLGDYSRALYGRMEYGNEVTFLVQERNLLLRISVASLEANPTDVAADISRAMLASV